VASPSTARFAKNANHSGQDDNLSGVTAIHADSTKSFVGAVEVDEIGGGGVVGYGRGSGGFQLAENFGGEDFA
jgi:hypothetical protein